MTDATLSPEQQVQERYARFARHEAPGRSALYEDWAAGVASHPATAVIIARIPATHRQPPLVFAVTRLLGAPEEPFAQWSAWLREHADEVVTECGRRGVQTNEPLRAALLLPALSLIDGPIALLEVGASAGLCLYPDRYSYRYRGADEVRVEGEFREVEPPARLVQTFQNHLQTLEFEDLGDERTKLTQTMSFATTEERDTTMQYGVEEGAKGGFLRVDAVLQKLSARTQ